MCRYVNDRVGGRDIVDPCFGIRLQGETDGGGRIARIGAGPQQARITGGIGLQLFDLRRHLIRSPHTHDAETENGQTVPVGDIGGS